MKHSSDIFFHAQSMCCSNRSFLKQSVHVESEHLYSISSLAIIASIITLRWGARLVAIDSKGKIMKLWERFKELDTKIVTSSLMGLKEDAFWNLNLRVKRQTTQIGSTMAVRIVLAIGLNLKPTPGLIMEARWTKLATWALGGGRGLFMQSANMHTMIYVALEEKMKMSSSNPFL